MGRGWVEDCVHTHFFLNVISNPLAFWVGRGGWGHWRDNGVGGDSAEGVGVRGIGGVRVEHCVPTHASYVMSNPLGFWVGSEGWEQWGGVGTMG